MTAAFLTPDDADGVFPWDLGDIDRGALVTVADRYDLPQARTASRAARAAAPHRGSDDMLGCLHTAGPGAVPVIARGRVQRCRDCEDHAYAQEGGDQFDELDAATALAHWTAWLGAAPSPTAATVLAGVLANIHGSDVTKSKAARRRMVDTLDRAHRLLQATPPAFEANQWALAVCQTTYVDDEIPWAYAITAGATIAQAEQYSAWLGFPLQYQSATPDIAQDAYLVWVPGRFSMGDYSYEPRLDTRVRIALGGPAFDQRGIWAIPGHAVASMERLSDLRLLTSASILNPEYLHESARNASPTTAIADLATQLWSKAGHNTKLSSVYDAIEAATSIISDPVATHTALALAPEWRDTGPDLAATATALSRP